RQTGDDRAHPEEGQGGRDRPRVGLLGCALRLLRAHATCSFVSSASAVSSRRAAWRTIFVHIHSGNAANTHHCTAYMTLRQLREVSGNGGGIRSRSGASSCPSSVIAKTNPL